MYIVKLEEGVWIDDVKSNDPGRTVVEKNAQQFKSYQGAGRALDYALKCRPFKNPEITKIEDK